MKVALHRLSSGAGPRFLLLHGFAQNRRTFTAGPLPGLLAARGAAVFAGELRGHGDSDRAPTRSLRAHLRFDLPALLETIGSPVHLIGHSMGGLLGYAQLALGGLASLTSMGAPIWLGHGRVLIRMAARVTAPLVKGAASVPIDRLLAVLAKPLSRPSLMARVTRLANAEQAAGAEIFDVLRHADAESGRVFAEMARLTRTRRPHIDGIDLVDAVTRSEIPVATVVGSDDAFGGRSSVAPLEAPGQGGPRKVVEIVGGRHVDLPIGHHLPQTIDELWPFLMA